MAICTSIKQLEHTQHYGDLLEVTIDNEVTALWFYPYDNAMDYVGQEVIVDYRNDIYDGQMRTFIKTFTLPTEIRTLDKEDEFKLYLDVNDDACNVVFSEFQENTSKMGCIVFCTKQDYKSSDKAVWMELTIRDKTMHTAKMRIFNYENISAELEGRYIVTSMVKTAFGFQTHEASPLNGDAVANPEVDLAEQYIRNYFSNDVVAMDYVNKTNLLEVMKTHVDYEVGYGLMRMAMELAMIDTLKNISKDVSRKLLSHVVLTSYGYLTRKSSLSPTFNNVLLASQYRWENRNELTVILDDAAENKPNEYLVWQSVKSMVNTLLEIRKGTTFRR